MAKKTKQVHVPAWRPDFREVDRLPDIKVVRTDFFLNVITITLVIGIFSFLGFREYSTISLRASVEDLETNIADNERQNREHLQRHSEFLRLNRELEEIQSFLATPVRSSDLLLAIAQLRPESILFTNIAFNTRVETVGRQRRPGYVITLNGTVRGSPFEVPVTVNEFQEALESEPVIAEHLRRVDIRSLNRDPTLGHFTLAMAIELEPPPEKR